MSLDADVITWWQQTPYLVNWELLQLLRGLLRQGSLRSSAQAIAVFDPKWVEDVNDWKDLRSLARWAVDVNVTEEESCLASSQRPVVSRNQFRNTATYLRAVTKWPNMCKRAKGVWHVAGFSIADLPASRPGTRKA